MMSSILSSSFNSLPQERIISPSSRSLLGLLGALALLQTASMLAANSGPNSIGQEFVEIPAGTFTMGQQRDPLWREKGLASDEDPIRPVTVSLAFRMSTTEVTQAQFAAFRPGHRSTHAAAFRSLGFGDGDNDPVTFVSWYDAVEFCRWLTEKEGIPYRLPTEAEWEYACRAGTTTEFFSGKNLAPSLVKNQKEVRELTAKVDTVVGRTPPNAWGLRDMHGNVEEWVLDWYAAYPTGAQADPIGPADGIYKITRGGSHNTPAYFLRSANRSGSLPDDKHWLIGFRVVQAPIPRTSPTAPAPSSSIFQSVRQKPAAWTKSQKPLFVGPIEYVHPPVSDDTPFYKHNHSPVLTWCPNGDLLAFWFSTRDELGRELAVLGSRLAHGSLTWQPASLVAKAPDRNMHGFALFQRDGRIFFIEGINTGDRHDNIAIALSTSDNNGQDWTRPRMVFGDHVDNIQSACGAVLVRQNGDILLPTDGAGKPRSTRLLESRDAGSTWREVTRVEKMPEPTNGARHSLIAGWHAGVVERDDGSLLAVGREAPMGDGRMPISISRDGGQTWTYTASNFPIVSTSQRMLLMKLADGAILFASFTDDIVAVRKGDTDLAGMVVRDQAGQSRRIFGLFTAVSFDGGASWEGTKPLSPGGAPRELKSVRDTPFTMDATHACPNGYLAGAQTPDGVVHIVSSTHYYQTNLAWLRELMPAATPEEKEREHAELSRLEGARKSGKAKSKRSNDEDLNFNAK